MTEETLMTTNAATTPEGDAASQLTDPAATVAAEGGQPPLPDGAEKPPVGDGKPETEPAPGAPEKYDFTAPEGMTFDEKVIGSFSEIARELNLPQAEAQKVLDKMAPALAARQVEQLQAASQAWSEAARADQEFGGDKLSENLGVAKKALDAFASSDLKKLLNESGLGNHPEVIRMFYKVGKSIGEDGFVIGQQQAGDVKKSYAQQIYGE